MAVDVNMVFPYWSLLTPAIITHIRFNTNPNCPCSPKTATPRCTADLTNRRPSLFRTSKSCDIERMARPDLYDYIGLALAALVVALWVAHLVLPAAPPIPS